MFNREGEPIKSFRGSWEKASERAGVPDELSRSAQNGRTEHAPRWRASGRSHENQRASTSCACAHHPGHNGKNKGLTKDGQPQLNR